jgi:hypothetical protein
MSIKAKKLEIQKFGGKILIFVYILTWKNYWLILEQLAAVQSFKQDIVA